MSASIKRRAREATEAVLRRNAKAVRKVLLAAGADEAAHLPEIVQIESTNICNAKCVFCPRDDMERKQGVMDMALFRKVADECAALGITHVRMHNYGEAFVDRCIVELQKGELSPARASMAKYWTSEMLGRVVDECVQLHGGYGYMHEYPIAQAWLNARVQRIYAGTTEIMKEIIARSLL